MQPGEIFCAQPAQLGDGSMVRLPKNDKLTIGGVSVDLYTWFFDGDLAGLSDLQVDTIFQGAFDRWSQHGRMKWQKAANAQDCTISIITARIDGPQGVLADCQLPYPGMRRPLRCRFDNERFTGDLDPRNGYIGLPHVACHEFGHGIGFPHLPVDSTPDLMNPTYNPKVYAPQIDESTICRKLYGEPVQGSAPGIGERTGIYRIDEQGRLWSAEGRFRLRGPVTPELLEEVVGFLKG